MPTRQLLPIPGVSIWVKWDTADDEDDPELSWYKAYVHNITPVPTNSRGELANGTIEYPKTADYDSSTSPVLFLRGFKLQHLPLHAQTAEEVDDTPCPWTSEDPDKPFTAGPSHQNEPVTSYPQVSGPHGASAAHLIQVNTADIAQMKRQLLALQNSVALSPAGSVSSLSGFKQQLLWAVMQALQRPLVSVQKNTKSKGAKSSSQASDSDVSAHCGMVRSSIKVSLPGSFSIFTELVKAGITAVDTSAPLKFSPSAASYYLPYNPTQTYDVFSADFRNLCGLFGLQDPSVLSRFVLREANIVRIIGTFGYSADDTAHPAYLLPARSWDPKFVGSAKFLANTTEYSPDCPFYALRLNSTVVLDETLNFRNKFTSSYLPRFDFNELASSPSDRDKDVFRMSWTPPPSFTRQFRDLPLPPATELGEITVSFPTVSFQPAHAKDGSPVPSSIAHQVKTLLTTTVIGRICSASAATHY